MSTAATPLLQVSEIRRSFFGVEVLHGVSFELPPGRVLGVVGENGAGKSTLMNLLGGMLPPDSGRLVLAGQDYSPRSAREAERAGIGFIHQELNLFPELTITENLLLTDFPRRSWCRALIDPRASEREAVRLLKRVGLDLAPDTPVDRLRAGERQLVEIAKALRLDARLIIFDEPTTSLAQAEVERLFALIGDLRAQGIACIFVSHNLEHVLHLCDDVLVLRDGALVSHGPASSYTIDLLVSQMVGRPLEQQFPDLPSQRTDEVVLAACELSHPYVLHRVSFELHRGEILGISGLLGSGRTELLRAIFGLDPCEHGEVLLAGQSLRGLPPRERLARGLAFLTEDRRHEGLAMEASLADNLTLVALHRFVSGPLRLIDGRRRQDAIRGARQRMRITAAAHDQQPVRTLSGGNQQKVVLARWLLNEPEVLLLDEPTRGIDVGAKFEIYTLIHELAVRGKGILVVSSEIEELIGLCDRILIMRRGEICGSVNRPDFNREQILKTAFMGGSTS
jgi:ribose transport system ATP-binding protein